jgi:hypothetical protein
MVRKPFGGVFSGELNVEFSPNLKHGSSSACRTEWFCTLDGLCSTNIDGDMDYGRFDHFVAMRRDEPIFLTS